MRFVIFVFLVFGIHNHIFAQSIHKSDTCDKDYKIEQGKLRRFHLLDDGTYLFIKSNYYSFIEFNFLSWGTRRIKYRVEKILDSPTYILSKTISTVDDSSAITYIAIDSTAFNKIKKNRRSLDYLTKEKVCERLSGADSELFDSYLSFLKEHGLEMEFSNFRPSVFVAWVRIND